MGCHFPSPGLLSSLSLNSLIQIHGSGQFVLAQDSLCHCHSRKHKRAGSPLPLMGDQGVVAPPLAATHLLLFPLAFLVLCDTLCPETMPSLPLSLSLLFLFIFNILIGRDVDHEIPHFWRSIVPLTEHDNLEKSFPISVPQILENSSTTRRSLWTFGKYLLSTLYMPRHHSGYLGNIKNKIEQDPCPVAFRF